MTFKIWPIKQDLSCQLKWTWSTIYLTNSASASCHRTSQYKFDLDTFDDFHNLPEKLRDRAMMLRNEWPGNGCEFCKKIEDVGGISDRISSNTHTKNVVPKEVMLDPDATRVTPKMIEVYFDNTCDLKCTYCGPWYSSAWEAEIKKYPVVPIELQTVLRSDYRVSDQRRAYVEKFFEWWKSNAHELEHFHFLGGEPFFQPEFDELTDLIAETRNPNLTFVITTNLNCSNDRLRDRISRFRDYVKDGNIGRLQVTASLDCWGPQQEFIRYPLSLATWQENFEYLVEQDWLTLTTNSAISGLSIKTMPEFLRRVNEYRKTRPIYQNFMTVQDPHPLNPDYFGGDVFVEDFREIVDVLNQAVPLDPYYANLIPYMEGMARQIQASQPNKEKLTQLKAYLDELDHRRGTDWKSLFPWAVEQFNLKI